MNYSLAVVCVFASLVSAMLPLLVNFILSSKKKELDSYFEEQINSYTAFVSEHGHKPSLNASGDELNLARWAKAMSKQYQTKRLTKQRAAQLIDTGIVEADTQSENDSSFSGFLSANYNLPARISWYIALALLFSLPVGALLAFSTNYPAIAFATLGIIVGVVIIACDIRAKVIPWQLCVVSFVCAFEFQFFTNTWQGLFDGAICAVLATFAFSLIAGIFKGGIGAGDLRFIPSVAFFGGLSAFIYGLLTCAVIGLVMALYAILINKKDRKAFLPMAPALYGWLVIGISYQLLLV